MPCLDRTQLSGIDRVVVVLMRPTRYDDDGFPHRYKWGVLPSNSLAAVSALTNQILVEVLPEEVEVETYMLEDGIVGHADKLDHLHRSIPKERTKLIVCFVGVQTAEFPRAEVLIRKWQARGATCIIGGFHVSGTISTLLDGIKDPRRPDIPCPHIMPPEVQALMDQGVIVFHGEAEEVWQNALLDILSGNPKPLYRGGQPDDLTRAPLPAYPESYFRGNFASKMVTLDVNRGCPFLCSFCTIINVQGRRSRRRSPEAIISLVKDRCDRYGSVDFFYTDDNFARNPEWELILDGLIALRQLGYQISFMIEADLACYKIPNFIRKLGEAGCVQIFMGVESLNPENLREAGKIQNKVGEYESTWALCHEHGISVHAGYIIGFSHDTPESVARDINELFRLGVDQASFFMLMPLHGSEDHVRAFCAGTEMDSDLSRYDSFHAVVDHPQMTRSEWFATYRKTWGQFYSANNIIAILKRFKSHKLRLRLFRSFFWYRWSAIVERAHPMICGFWRRRPYHERRPGLEPISYPRYLGQELARYSRYLLLMVPEFFRFEHILFETECAPAIERTREEWSGRLLEVGKWFRLTFGKQASRVWLNDFWKRYASNRWQLLWNPLKLHWHIRIVPACVSEVVYGVRFLFMLPKLVRG